MRRQIRRKVSRPSWIESLEARCLLSASYTITDLGALPSGDGSSFATGINASGQVVGYSSAASDGRNHPFIYSNGTMRDLNPGGADSQASGINDSGQIVGKNGDAFLYSGGIMQSIGNLPGGNTSFAYAINNSGQVAGDSLTSDPSITHAFLYSNGQMQDLGTLGGSQSNAFALNNVGQIVGQAYNSDGVSHAFLWSNGQMQDLGALWNRAASAAKGINDSGQVVGYGYFWGLQPRHAFLYSNGKMTDLQTLGGESSAALAINNQGQIVGDSNDASGDDHAFIYANGQMQDLNALINTDSSWRLQVASAINSAGQIAGTGVINGVEHAFLLTPATVTNPPPGDTTPPTAVISAPSITAAGGSSEAVSVTYSDNVAVDVSTIAPGNIGVSGPGGALQVIDVQVSSASNGSPITVTYTVAAPGGSWQASGNGNYSVTLVGGSVKDTSGNGVATATGTFSVSVGSADSTPPSAQISAPNVTTGGAGSATITVVYTDNVAVNATSINAGNISVTGPAGALNVTSAHANGGSGSPLVVTYTIAAPHGTWSSADNGSYIIALKANQVADTSGNFATGASGSFTVNVPPPVSSGPDQSFNNGQPVGTNFVSEAIVTQSDGKIIAVGRIGDLSSGTSQGVIERFNSDGSVDASFGSGGMVTTPSGSNEAFYAAVMQDASHLIAAGTEGGNFVLTRYDLSGRVDPTFGVQGSITSDFGASDDTARGLAIAPGGLIVAGGDSGANFAFARYTASGNLDSNFAQGGQQLFGLGSGSSNGMGGILAQSDGKILGVGAEGGSVVAVSLTSAGEADGSFGNGGLVTVPGLLARTDLGTPDRSEAMALEPNGQLLVANRTSSGHFGLVRLNANGTTDTSFGSGGLVTADFGGDDDADAIVLQSSGPIVLVGTSNQGGSAQTAIAAFDPAGNPVSSFGTGGLMLLPNAIANSTMKAASLPGVVRPSALHVG
ncbi:MAG TPA: DUF3466 family protein, partial [Tepidisphaeraceae bacterium]|nr:DUF3466 family protein [Tepidisphaeraceae bacterium]